MLEQTKLDFDDLKVKSKDKRVAWRRFSQFNAKGELVSETVTARPRQLGGEWIVFYKKALKQLVMDCPALSVCRIYLYLASKQTFETFVIVTPAKIMADLQIARKTFYDGIKWLKENGYVQQHEHDGNIAWLLNPSKTTRGSGKQSVKNALWSLTNKAVAIGQSAKQVQVKRRSIDTETGEILEDGADESAKV